MKVFIRSQLAANYDADKASAEVGLECLDVSKTVQADAESADINFIMKKYNATGVAPQNIRVPLLADFVDVFDFRSAMNAVRQAGESFMLMPADVRSRFDNDPQKFVGFCTELSPDGKVLKNLEEMRKFGLAVPPAPVEVMPSSKPVVVSPAPVS